MTLRSLKYIALLSSLAWPVLLPAQTSTSSSEEERLQKLMTDSSQWYVPKNRVSLGFRVLSAAGHVKYGNLGRVDAAFSIPDLTKNESRSYNNGNVGADGLRTNEIQKDANGELVKDANGNYVQIALDANGRYSTTATTAADITDPNTGEVLFPTGTVYTNGDLLGYVAGRTRNWTYTSDTQVTPSGEIGMSIYSAVSQGGSAEKDTGISGGVEFQFSRAFGRGVKRVEWGWTAGVALNNINNKTNGTVVSSLHTYTDYYSLLGQAAPTAPYSTASAVADYTDPVTGTVTPNGLETTVPLASTPTPTKSGTTDTPNGVEVNGNWQIKGAYFLVRLGPSVRAQVTERLGLSASLGLAGAYTGSTYSVVESFAVPNISDATVQTPELERNSMTKFLNGYYADLTLEWATNERTAVFGGFTAQQLGDYDQMLNGRTAHIDLGSAVGLRGGVSIRF